MKRELCELIVNYPTVTLLCLSALAVLCLFSILGTVCFLGVFCLLIRSVQAGRKNGWLRDDALRSERRQADRPGPADRPGQAVRPGPRHRRPEPRQRSDPRRRAEDRREAYHPAANRR